MLRLDPGESRITTARNFRVWEGGGEYNVARGLSQCFRMRTAVVTALVDNPVGRLIEDLIRQGDVDRSYIHWEPFDGVGRIARNGLNFTERGFGLRAPIGCSDRGQSAASQMQPGQVPWDRIFDSDGARWLHTGGIFAALSGSTADVVHEAIEAAHQGGAVVSYDLNYRPSLWHAMGGAVRAQQVNREIASEVDVLLGNEEDFDIALGLEDAGQDPAHRPPDAARSHAILRHAHEAFPNLRVVTMTLRTATTATRNDWGVIGWANGTVQDATLRQDLEVLDRVGSGDGFVSGLIYGLLTRHSFQESLEYGAAHGALVMTTPGDNSMVTREEVEAVIEGRAPRIAR
jgi:2-dehydro-3-deoxygluconokinase